MGGALETTYGLKKGTPAIQSLGALAFGPDGILFAADNRGATIFALEMESAEPAAEATPLDVHDLDARLAAYLGCPRAEVFIKDIAVHPVSQRVYLSVMRGSGAEALPVLLMVGPDDTLADVSLRDIPFAQASIEDAPADDDPRKEGRLVQGTREGSDMEPRPGFKIRVAFDNLRTVTVTDMAYVNGVLLVAGVSNEEFSSTLRRIPFPFTGASASNSLEIYHVSHAKYETASPIRTFLPYQDNAGILASYTCTPVVHFSLTDLQPGARAKGRTVAELGGGNTPLDMVAFTRDGEEYVLVSNARHPLMALKRSDIEKQPALTEPREPVGVPRKSLPQQGVSRMANLNNSFIVMLQMDEAEHYHLRSYSTADLSITACRPRAASGMDHRAHLSWADRGGRLCLAMSGDIERRVGGWTAIPTDEYARRLAILPSDLMGHAMNGRNGRAFQPLPGTFELDDDVLYFTPRFPFLRCASYALVLDGSDVWTIGPARASASPSTKVVGIYPSAAVVPVNLLKVYIRFSAPMSEGWVARAVLVTRADDGEPLRDVFLETASELWDPGRMRLTMLLDPARIKRGLLPHLEAGYPLVEGRSICVTVNAPFRDANGEPLRESASQRYEVGPAVHTRVAEASWRVDCPRIGSTDALTVQFGRPLDHAMLAHALRVQDEDGLRVSGRTTLGVGESSWRFLPDTPWAGRRHLLAVDGRLEDLAGNSLVRVFDRDSSTQMTGLGIGRA